MADTNDTAATGSVPFGRIAGVVILVGSVVALGVVAMTNPSRDIDPDTVATTNVSTQPEASEDTDAPPKADLSDASSVSSEVVEGTSPTSLSAEDQFVTTPGTGNRPPVKQPAIKPAPNADKTRPNQNQNTGNPNAMIQFGSLVYNFGDIYSTKPVNGEFSFTSTGTEDLIIEQVRTTCGCTSSNAADLRNSRWEPGTGATINFTYEPNQNPGTQTKTIVVTTNSANEQRITLTLKANYIPAVKTTQRMADFGRIQAGNIGLSRVVLESRDPDFQFKDFDLADAADQFTWSYSELDPVSEDYPSRGQLLIRTKPDAAIGPFNRIIGRMIFLAREGDAEEQSEIELNLPLRGEVIGQIALMPRFGRSPLALPGSPFEHKTVVSATNNKPFKITDIKLADGEITDFEYEIAPAEDQAEGMAYQLTIRGTAPDRAGGYMGRVEIYTDIENHGPMPYQFSGVLRAQAPQTQQ